MICMSISHGSNGKSLTSSLLVCVRSVDKLNVPSCLFKLLAHSSDTHAFPTRHLVTLSKSELRKVQSHEYVAIYFSSGTDLNTNRTEQLGLKKQSFKSWELAPRDGFIAPDHKGSMRTHYAFGSRGFDQRLYFDVSHPCFVSNLR